ncbi:MAG: hypothetical protein ABH885_08005, partial [Candidatus Omnitrophota bacterium]
MRKTNIAIKIICLMLAAAMLVNDIGFAADEVRSCLAAPSFFKPPCTVSPDPETGRYVIDEARTRQDMSGLVFYWYLIASALHNGLTDEAKLRNLIDELIGRRFKDTDLGDFRWRQIEYDSASGEYVLTTVDGNEKYRFSKNPANAAARFKVAGDTEVYLRIEGASAPLIQGPEPTTQSLSSHTSAKVHDGRASKDKQPKDQSLQPKAFILWAVTLIPLILITAAVISHIGNLGALWNAYIAFFDTFNGNILKYTTYYVCTTAWGHCAASLIDKDKGLSRYIIAVVWAFIVANLAIPYYVSAIKTFVPDLGIWSHWMRPAADLFLACTPLIAMSFFVMAVRERVIAEKTAGFEILDKKWIKETLAYTKEKMKLLYARNGFFKIAVLFWFPVIHFTYYSSYTVGAIIGIAATLSPFFAVIGAVYVVQRPNHPLTPYPGFNKFLKRAYLIPVSAVAGLAVAAGLLGYTSLAWNAAASFWSTIVGYVLASGWTRVIRRYALGSSLLKVAKSKRIKEEPVTAPLSGKKIVIFGGGVIGRGFIAELFRKGGYEVVLLDVDQAMIDKVNENGSYPLYLVGKENRKTIITGARALNIAGDEDRVMKEVLDADILALAVPEKALKPACVTIGKCLEHRLAQVPRAPPIDIIIARNMPDPSKDVRDRVLGAVSAGARPAIEDGTGFVETVVSRMMPVIPESVRRVDPSSVFGEAYSELPVNKSQFKGALPGNVPGLRFHDGLTALEDRKLYMHNCGHAICAYLGYLKRYKYIYEAIRDDSIKEVVEGALHEAAEGLIRKYAFDRDEMDAHIRELIGRFDNEMLADTIDRVGRDPLRKLKPADRLVGPARLALECGVKPVNLAKGIAAATQYFDAKDESAVALHRMINEKGLDHVLEEISGIKPDEELRGLIKPGRVVSPQLLAVITVIELFLFFGLRMVFPEGSFLVYLNFVVFMSLGEFFGQLINKRSMGNFNPMLGDFDGRKVLMALGLTAVFFGWFWPLTYGLWEPLVPAVGAFIEAHAALPLPPGMALFSQVAGALCMALSDALCTAPSSLGIIFLAHGMLESIRAKRPVLFKDIYKRKIAQWRYAIIAAWPYWLTGLAIAFSLPVSANVQRLIIGMLEPPFVIYMYYLANKEPDPDVQLQMKPWAKVMFIVFAVYGFFVYTRLVGVSAFAAGVPVNILALAIGIAAYCPVILFGWRTAQNPELTTQSPKPKPPLGMMPWIWGKPYRYSVEGEKRYQKSPEYIELNEEEMLFGLADLVRFLIGFIEEAIIRPLIQWGVIPVVLYFGFGMNPEALPFSVYTILYAFLFATVLHPKIFVGNDTEPRAGILLVERLQLFCLAAVLGLIFSLMMAHPFGGFLVIGVLHGVYNNVAYKYNLALGMMNAGGSDARERIAAKIAEYYTPEFKRLAGVSLLTPQILTWLEIAGREGEEALDRAMAEALNSKKPVGSERAQYVALMVKLGDAIMSMAKAVGDRSGVGSGPGLGSQKAPSPADPADDPGAASLLRELEEAIAGLLGAMGDTPGLGVGTPQGSRKAPSPASASPSSGRVRNHFFNDRELDVLARGPGNRFEKGSETFNKLRAVFERGGPEVRENWRGYYMRVNDPEMRFLNWIEGHMGDRMSGVFINMYTYEIFRIILRHINFAERLKQRFSRFPQDELLEFLNDFNREYNITGDEITEEFLNAPGNTDIVMTLYEVIGVKYAYGVQAFLIRGAERSPVFNRASQEILEAIGLDAINKGLKPLGFDLNSIVHMRLQELCSLIGMDESRVAPRGIDYVSRPEDGEFYASLQKEIKEACGIREKRPFSGASPALFNVVIDRRMPEWGNSNLDAVSPYTMILALARLFNAEDGKFLVNTLSAMLGRAVKLDEIGKEVQLLYFNEAQRQGIFRVLADVRDPATGKNVTHVFGLSVAKNNVRNSGVDEEFGLIRDFGARSASIIRTYVLDRVPVEADSVESELALFSMEWKEGFEEINFVSRKAARDFPGVMDRFARPGDSGMDVILNLRGRGFTALNPDAGHDIKEKMVGILTECFDPEKGEFLNYIRYNAGDFVYHPRTHEVALVSCHECSVMTCLGTDVYSAEQLNAAKFIADLFGQRYMTQGHDLMGGRMQGYEEYIFEESDIFKGLSRALKSKYGQGPGADKCAEWIAAYKSVKQHLREAMSYAGIGDRNASDLILRRYMMPVLEILASRECVSCKAGMMFEILKAPDINGAELEIFITHASEHMGFKITEHERGDKSGAGHDGATVTTEPVRRIADDLSPEKDLIWRHVRFHANYCGHRLSEINQMIKDEEHGIRLFLPMLYIAEYIETKVGIRYAKDFFDCCKFEGMIQQTIEMLLGIAGRDERIDRVFRGLRGMHGLKRAVSRARLLELWQKIRQEEDLRAKNRALLNIHAYNHGPEGLAKEAERKKLVITYLDSVKAPERVPFRFETLGVSPTYACGRNCRHCQIVRPPGARPALSSADERHRIYDEAISYATEEKPQLFVISGGEPIGKALDDVCYILRHSGPVYEYLPKKSAVAVTTNAFFAKDMDETERVLKKLHDAFKEATGGGKKLSIQVSMDSFHQEVLLAKDGSLKERIPIANIVNVMQCVREKFPDIHVRLIGRYGWNADMLETMLIREFKRRKYNVYSGTGNIKIETGRLLYPDGRYREKRFSHESIYFIEKETAPAPEPQPGKFVQFEYYATFINALGYGENMHPFEHAIEVENQMASAMNDPARYENPVDDIGVDGNGDIFIDGSLLTGLWPVGNVREGIGNVVGRAEADPLVIFYRNDPKRLVDWIREALPYYFDRTLVRAPHISAALHKIMRSPAMRYYLTKRAILAFYRSDIIRAREFAGLNMPYVDQDIIEEFLRDYAAETARIEARGAGMIPILKYYLSWRYSGRELFLRQTLLEQGLFWSLNSLFYCLGLGIIASTAFTWLVLFIGAHYAHHLLGVTNVPHAPPPGSILKIAAVNMLFSAVVLWHTRAMLDLACLTSIISPLCGLILSFTLATVVHYFANKSFTIRDMARTFSRYFEKGKLNAVALVYMTAIVYAVGAT